MKKKVYISGPITGKNPKEVEKNFSRAEKYLLLMGFEVMNPLKNGLPKSSTWKRHMRVDKKMLRKSDAFCRLQGWENSKGANIEINLAHKLGIKEINLNEKEITDEI